MAILGKQSVQLVQEAEELGLAALLGPNPPGASGRGSGGGIAEVSGHLKDVSKAFPQPIVMCCCDLVNKPKTHHAEKVSCASRNTMYSNNNHAHSTQGRQEIWFLKVSWSNCVRSRCAMTTCGWLLRAVNIWMPFCEVAALSSSTLGHWSPHLPPLTATHHTLQAGTPLGSTHERNHNSSCSAAYAATTRSVFGRT